MGRPMTEPSHPAKSRSELPGLKQTRSNPPTYRQTRRIIHAKAAIRLGVIFFPAGFRLLLFVSDWGVCCGII